MFCLLAPPVLQAMPKRHREGGLRYCNVCKQCRYITGDMCANADCVPVLATAFIHIMHCRL